MKTSYSTRQNLYYSILLIITSVLVITVYRWTNNQWILYQQAEAYFEQKEYNKAIEYYNKSLAEGLEKPSAFEQLAKSYMIVGNFDEAIKVYRKYLEINPKDRQARLSFARLLAWNKNFEESENEFKILLENENE